MVIITWVLILPLAAVGALLVHELAHGAVGITLGLKPAELRVSLLEICFVQRQIGERPAATLDRLFSGGVIFSPEGTGMRWKWATVSIAGPIASLIAGAAVLLTGEFGWGLAHGNYPQSPFDILRLEFILLSAMLFVANIYPGDNPFSPNDWFHFSRAIEGGETWARWEACLILLYRNWLGYRPCLWPTSILPLLVRPNDRSRTALRAYVLRIYMLGDRRDCNAVAESVQLAAALADRYETYAVFGEFAFWEIVAGCDSATAAASLKRAQKRIRNDGHPSILKARALLTNKNDADRESIQRLALQAVEREIASGGGGIGIAEREWLLSDLAS